MIPSVFLSQVFIYSSCNKTEIQIILDNTITCLELVGHLDNGFINIHLFPKSVPQFRWPKTPDMWLCDCFVQNNLNQHRLVNTTASMQPAVLWIEHFALLDFHHHPSLEENK